MNVKLAIQCCLVIAWMIGAACCHLSAQPRDAQPPHAQPPVAQSPAGPTSADLRLAFLQERASRFSLFPADKPSSTFILKPEPVLRFSNPEREVGTTDGALFLWLDGSRPVAALCMGIRRPGGAVFREHTSFTQSPLSCEKTSGIAWSPKSNGFADRAFPDAPPPGRDPAPRLQQMRTLARRFSGTCSKGDQHSELRLLTQPLYRFADEPAGILDGGLFALALGNDAEALILLQAQTRPAKAPAWQFSLARLTFQSLRLELDGHEIWSVPRFSTIPSGERKSNSYLEAQEGFYAPEKSQSPGN